MATGWSLLINRHSVKLLLETLTLWTLFGFSDALDCITDGLARLCAADLDAGGEVSVAVFLFAVE